VYDLERLNSKIAMASANAKDLMALRASLEKLPQIDDQLSSFQSDYLKKIRQQLDLLPELVSLLDQAIVADPPFVLRDGGLIKDGFNPELDELRTISRDGKGWIAALEQQERERTGIPSLKVKYNKVFGYFIEITLRNLDRVPEDYQRKQTLTNAERFITPQLKEYEEKVLGAEDRIVELEYNLFQQVRLKASGEGGRIQQSAEALAVLDSLLSLADLAHERNYVCPQIDNSGVIQIDGGRHPVVEGMPLKEPFTEKMKLTLTEMVESDRFKAALEQGLDAHKIGEDIIGKVETVIDKRLNELTPQLVKEMVQQIIRQHLGWLVVWGGVFGGIMGAGFSFA